MTLSVKYIDTVDSWLIVGAKCAFGTLEFTSAMILHMINKENKKM